MYLKGQRLKMCCFNYHDAAVLSILHAKKKEPQMTDQ